MRNFNITVEGKTYSVQVEEVGASASSFAAPKVADAPKAAPVAASSSGGTSVKSPLPGMVVGFKVENGTAVKTGQVIAILEAMKMENDIVAPCDGIFTAVAAKGSTVNTGDVLATIK